MVSSYVGARCCSRMVLDDLLHWHDIWCCMACGTGIAYGARWCASEWPDERFFRLAEEIEYNFLPPVYMMPWTLCVMSGLRWRAAEPGAWWPWAERLSKMSRLSCPSLPTTSAP
eukprot:1163094-Rhodomonas_salina.6